MSLPVQDRLIVCGTAGSRVNSRSIEAGHFAYAPEWLADAAAPPLSQALGGDVAGAMAFLPEDEEPPKLDLSRSAQVLDDRP
jgi:hypothetical protein